MSTGLKGKNNIMSAQDMLNFHSMDYSKWKRSTRSKPLLWATSHHKAVISSNKGETRPSPTGKSGTSQSHLHNDFTTLPKLLTRRTTETVEQDQITTKTKYSIKELILLIKSRKEAIKDLEELCEQLQERNLQMARSITDTDRSSFARANNLLIQTEQKMRSAVALKQWNDNLIKSARAELRDIKETLQTHRSGLQKQLDLLKVKVVDAQKELCSLKTYKDMEFPVKALQIADMERKLDRLKDMQRKEQEDLNLLFKKEMVNLERRQHQREQKVLSTVAEKHASHIPPVVKLTASQNDTMREEIHQQRNVVMEMERKNEELRKSIQELQLSRTKNIRREFFPDVFIKSDKCTPDMDVHLNIPQVDLLPV
uniref:Si:dkey-76p14.2 n=1 Tax=Cyprinus carpio TaxID=7962 RepID=A0A8C2H6T7_CYPCA